MATEPTDIELRIRAVLDNLQGLTGLRGELANLSSQSDSTTSSTQKLDAAMQELGGVARQIDAYRDLQRQLRDSESSLATARESQRALTAAVVASLGPSQDQLREQERSNASVARLEQQVRRQLETQKGLTQQVIAAEEPNARLIRRHEDATRKLEGLQRALEAARDRQRSANQAVAAGSEPSAKLAREHDNATRSVERLSDQVLQEQAELQRLAGALGAAGVKVNDLDASSAQVSRTLQQAAAGARTFAEAQAALKLVPHGEIAAEIDKVRAAYDTLKASGRLTQTELAQAGVRLQEQLIELEHQTNGWAESLAQAGGELLKAGGSFAPLAVAVKQAIDFEQSMAGVRKVVDASAEDFARLQRQILDLSTTLPISAEGLAAITAAGGQLGVPLQQLGQFTELAARVATAFDITADQAGDAIAKLSNVFGTTLTGTEDLADAINVLGNTTAATEGGILDFLTRVGGSAKTFGLSAQAAAALGAAFISLGKAPEVAANAVNGLLTRLQTANVQSPKVQEALARIGISASDLAGRITADPQRALDGFLQTLKELDAQSRAEAIAEIVGLEYSDDINLLVGSLDQYRAALVSVGDASATAGSLTREFEARMGTASAQLDLLKNAASKISVDVGTALLPLLTGLAAGGSSLANAFGEVVELAPELTSFLAVMAAVKVSASALALVAANLGLGLAKVSPAAAAAVAGISALARSLVVALGAIRAFGLAGGPLIVALGAIASVLPEVGTGLGELAAKALGADAATQQLRRSQVEQAEASRQQAIQSRLAVQELQNFALLGRDAVLRLSGAEQAAYAQRLADRQAYLQAINREASALALAAGDDEKRQQAAKQLRDQAVAGFAELRTATHAYQQALDLAARSQAEGLGVSTLLLIEQFEQLRSSGQSAAEAIASILPSLPEAPNGLRDALELLDALVERGKITSADLQNTLASAFSGKSLDELNRFEVVARAAFDETGQGARRLGLVIDALRQEQFRALGVDAEAVLAGIDGQARSLLDTFQALVSDPSVDLRIVADGARKLLTTLDSPEELRSFVRLLEEAATKGRGVPAVLEEARKKLAALEEAANPAAKAIADAFAAFGIQTRQQLEQAAIQAEENFRKVTASGQATATGLLKAFEDYARAQIEAGKPVLANTDAQRKIVEALTAGYEKLTGAAGDAGKTAADGHRDAAQAAASEFNSITQLINARAVLSEADQRRIRDIREEAEALREKNSLVNAADRINDLKGVSAAAASIDGRGAVGFGKPGVEELARIEETIRQAIRAGRLASDALGDTRIESPADIAAARRQLRDAQGLAARLGGVTGSQAVEARTLSEELERGAAALERAVARFEREAVNNGGARTVTPGTNLGRDQIVFNPGGTASPQQPAPLPTPQPIQTIRVELVLGGQVIPGLFTQNDAQRLVDLLERSQLSAQGGG